MTPLQRARVHEALALANVPTLIPMLVQMTGERRWLDGRYRPTRNRGLDDNPTGGLPEPVQDEIRSAALDAVIAWSGGRPLSLASPSFGELVEMLGVAMGEEVPAEYGPLIAAELGIARHAPPSRPRERARTPLRVLVIGAGVSGIAAGVKLAAAGLPYTILERRATVGGTWLENRYPGCGVDTPSALYSYSFAPHDWSRYFALRDELQAYLELVATEHGVREHIRFGTEALAATYEEATQTWAVDVRDADGASETIRAEILITAVGAFGRPKLPAIPGLDSFAGRCVHTARWPGGLELRDKRVAVVGTGASAMQLVPAIAPEVEQLTVFQRSPQWVAPFEFFGARVPEPVRFLSNMVPLYRIWYRLRAAWTFNDRIHSALQKDPHWPHPERSLNAVNDAHRRFFTRHIETELGDRHDLRDAVLPSYPPYGKRILLDNGWYRTLTRDNVRLVTERIASVASDGVITESGAGFAADVLVCATGFDVVRFLAGIDVRGRAGRSLREAWDDDDPRAYKGTTVPGFPNLFMVYGPNTQAGHGGSLIGSAESQLDYIIDLIRQMVEEGLSSVECREDVYERYNARVDDAHERMVWTHPGMDTYYRNARGRVVVNTPFRIVDFWHMTRNADLDDYRVQRGVTSGSDSRRPQRAGIA